MCFSATGSFAVSGALAGLGGASIARNQSPSLRMFAATPLVFAAQQATEGAVWLTLGSAPHETLHRVAIYAYLVCAMVIWPTWLPWSLRLAEREPSRRRPLTAIAVWGALFSACALFVLAHGRPSALVAGHSLRYEYGASGAFPLPLLYFLAYALPIVVPLFVSTVHQARTIGTLLIVSLGATVLIQRHALTSVWCFFAAILSGVILLAIEQERRSAAGVPRSGLGSRRAEPVPLRAR
jgi:uncharacterized protein DUF6629